MHNLLIGFLSSVFSNTLNFFSQLDPGYLDVLKIIVGTIGWIGGLTYFMWRRDRQRQTQAISV